MSYLSDFKYDIFISYARLDNIKFKSNTEGWVDDFHKTFKAVAEEYIGQKIEIWQDKEKIEGNMDFREAIQAAVKKSAVFVAMTSESYFKSEWCIPKELKIFHKKANEEPIGIKLGVHSRIFNVVTQDIKHEKWPKELERTSGFPFYEKIQANVNRKLKLDSEKFDIEIRKLATALKNTLEKLKEEKDDKGIKKHQYKVYLAAVAENLKDKFTRLKEELELNAIKVIQPPPPHEEGLEKAIIDKMLDANLSVHLMDDSAGEVIDGMGTETYPLKQLKLGLKKNVLQFIWVPSDMNPEDIKEDELKNLIKNLNQGKTDTGESEYLIGRGCEADLVKDIYDKLERMNSIQKRERLNSNSEAENDHYLTLLEAHPYDHHIVTPKFKGYLGENEIKSLYIPYNPESFNPKEYKAELEKHLERADAIIIIYGHVNSDWVKARMEQDVLCAFSKDIELKAVGIYLATETSDKNKVKMKKILNIHYLDNRKGFNPNSFKNFFQSLKSESKNGE